jgi:hypothetical protein
MRPMLMLPYEARNDEVMMILLQAVVTMTTMTRMCFADEVDDDG